MEPAYAHIRSDVAASVVEVEDVHFPDDPRLHVPAAAMQLDEEVD